ncbi:hypothetical protein Tco_1120005, partial [Tanacetum coccineum]
MGIDRRGSLILLLAPCQKLHSHEQMCCQALSGAVYVETKPPSCIVPRIRRLLERISKKRTKNEAKTTKPDTEWKSVEKKKSSQSP